MGCCTQLATELRARGEQFEALDAAFRTCRRASAAMLAFAHDEPLNAADIPLPGDLARHREALGKGVGALVFIDGPFVDTYRGRLAPPHRQLLDSIMSRYRPR